MIQNVTVSDDFLRANGFVEGLTLIDIQRPVRYDRPLVYKKGEKESMTNINCQKVWSAADGDQGKFSGINQPSAGARFEQTLPVGKAFSILFAWDS